MRRDLLFRLRKLERRLPDRRQPPKARLPAWLVGELQKEDVRFDSSGRPNLSSWPGEPVKEAPVPKV